MGGVRKRAAKRLNGLEIARPFGPLPGLRLALGVFGLLAQRRDLAVGVRRVRRVREPILEGLERGQIRSVLEAVPGRLGDSLKQHIDLMLDEGRMRRIGMRVEETLELVEVGGVLNVGPVDPFGSGRVEDIFAGERAIEDRMLALVCRRHDRSGHVGEYVRNRHVRRGYPLDQRDVIGTVLPLAVLGDVARRRSVGDHHAGAARRVVLVEAGETDVPGQLRFHRPARGLFRLGRIVSAGVEDKDLYALDRRKHVEELVDRNAADVDVIERLGFVVDLDQIVPAPKLDGVAGVIDESDISVPRPLVEFLERLIELAKGCVLDEHHVEINQLQRALQVLCIIDRVRKRLEVLIVVVADN